uniref:Uncharacterized protein n=1 Tax=Romanomermis culicivorax TaxID=13658 RepID=A0A915K396_ROMCU
MSRPGRAWASKKISGPGAESKVRNPMNDTFFRANVLTFHETSRFITTNWDSSKGERPIKVPDRGECRKVACIASEIKSMTGADHCPTTP